MAMTNCWEEIEQLTNKKKGKLYYQEKSYDIYEKGDYIFDKNSGNFHYLPQISDDNKGIFLDYLNGVKSLREEIIKKLQKDEELSLEVGEGSGNINPPPEGYDKGFNAFFRYLFVERGGLSYCINFMRWEIDENDAINCYLGEIQCDVTKDKFEFINHKVFRKNEYMINYPSKNKPDHKDEKFVGVFDFDKKFDISEISNTDKEELAGEIYEWFKRIIKNKGISDK